MDKEVLIQYCELMEEIKDIRRRIRELDKFLENPPIVADTVKGSRADLTIGPIKVNGFPDPMLYRKKRAAERYWKLLTAKEAELLELTTKAEEYIEAIKKPDLRIMFRFYYLEGLTWIQVAYRLNRMFPKRRVKYTEDGCRMRNSRFFEEK